MALATYYGEEKRLLRVNKQQVFGIMPRNAEQSYAVNALINPNLQLIALSGKAGTGKTLLALAAALEIRKEYRQIYLARPIVPLSDRDIGYLPGDIKSKLDPYMQPLFDNLSVIRHQFSEKDSRTRMLTKMLEKEKLVITPLAYIRGRSFQKVFFIIDEAQNLVSNGAREIILLGQNVNAYHYDRKYRLSSLIKALSNIKNLKRIRFTTSHPKDMTEDLIDCYRDCEKLMPFLHLPIQSGSNKMLKLMNRKHNREYYISIVEKLKKINKDIKISSDFIVGYPGETEKDFEDTIKIVEKIGFVNSYSFIFSIYFLN